MNWGQQNLDRLIYRAQLEYWRGKQKDARAYAFSAAKKVWNHMHKDHFIQMVNLGSWPDVVSGFPDSIRRLDFRVAALEHDIDYFIGGSEQARRNADIRLYKWIIEHFPTIAGRAVASYVYLAVRGVGWRKKHFYYDGDS